MALADLLFPAAATPRAHVPLATRPVPTSLWTRCDNVACGQLLYRRELERHLKVCPRCNHHFRLTARERIHQVTDEGTFVEHDAERVPSDPLGFVSMGQSYPDKIRETQRKTESREASVCGSGSIGGLPVELAVMDFAFLGGSMGAVVGDKLVHTVERAIARHCAVVTVSCSGGARMHEGLVSLMQMARTAAAVSRLHEARLPLLSVLTDPTTGGVTASFASLGDVLIAEPGALIGFAGPRVIEQVIKQKLPPGAQRAEFLLQRGMLDLIICRRDLRDGLVNLLRLYSTGGSPHGQN